MSTKNVKKTVLAAAFGALVFAATWILVPAPLGNVNLGDSMLLLGAWALGGPLVAVACALGAALCDLLSAYAIYAPATLLIKACMVFAALGVQKLTQSLPRLLRLLLCALSAEAVMVTGYFAWECILYGALPAAVNIPFNLIQGGICTVVAIVLYELLHRTGLLRLLNEKS
ncbi:MAG: ECF transporter S component [Clostridia bacterium]|nr:ECF transporter S component [Clostridia bacterium]